MKLATLAAALLTPPPRSDATLRFRDAASGTPVVLVGTMHCNPTSCALAKRTVRQTAREQGLSSVLLELCDARWNSTRAEQILENRQTEEAAADADDPVQRFRRFLYEDEFQASFEAAHALGVRVELADQPIKETLQRLSQEASATVSDMRSADGWRRIAADVRKAYLQYRGVPADDGGSGAEGGGVGGAAGGAEVDAPRIGLRSVLDPALVAGYPVALLRYFSLSPALFGTVLGGAFVLDAFLQALASDPGFLGAIEPALEAALTVAIGTVAVRVGLVALLEERNYVLARSIRRACREQPAAADGGGEPPAVVAVLGMAHLNGVRQLLSQSRPI